jgi:hypothetical protein
VFCAAGFEFDGDFHAGFNVDTVENFPKGSISEFFGKLKGFSYFYVHFMFIWLFFIF